MDNFKKLKIGIITMYYGSTNYGGNLQAYALPHFLNKLGYDAKQISYPVTGETSGASPMKKFLRNFKKAPINCFKVVVKTIFRKVKNYFHKKDLRYLENFKRKKTAAFQNFQLNLIPHTDEIYNDAQLSDTNDDFDVFITGSDQVFNTNLAKPGYFLNFVNDDKIKISYAASMALNNIPGDKRQFWKQTLEKYSAISVREERTVELLKELTGKDIELTVDPTLLLEASDWNKIASERLINKKYVFCYFLGDNKDERRAAKEYAQQNHLTLVCIPMRWHNYKQIDLDFGDINLPFASPEDFISLIMHAEYIFTDSFHACVFSLIYKKRFLVFNRDKSNRMNTRIVSLMKLFGTENRFLSTSEQCSKEKVEAILSEEALYSYDEFSELKQSSIEFLARNL